MLKPSKLKMRNCTSTHLSVLPGLILILIQTGSIRLLSQLSFDPPAHYSVGSIPRFVAIGNNIRDVKASGQRFVEDFNLDGNPDLVVVNQDSDNISVLFGNSNGTFGPPSNYPVQNFPSAVAIAKFNSDHYLDLAVANTSSGTVSIFTGTGNGSFVLQSHLPAGSSPVFVAAGDFDRDGWMDLAVANSLTSGTVTILMNNGDGTFTNGGTYLAGNGPRAIAINDFNLDGSLDLAVANQWGADLTILQGNADGTFFSRGNWSVEGKPWSLAIGDFNRNGAADLAVANSDSVNVSILFGRAQGPLVDFDPATPLLSNSGNKSIAVGDFNNDAFDDLAVANEVFNWVGVYLGNGAGGFGAQSTFAAGTSAGSVASADFNGDGRPDLAVTNPGGNNLTVLINKTISSADAVVAIGDHMIESRTFLETDCEVTEGCNQAGTRRLLKFTVTVSNSGQMPFYIGMPWYNALRPWDSPYAKYIAWSSCHGHYHFNDFIKFELVDSSTSVVATSRKAGWCLIDLSPPGGRFNCAPEESCSPASYDCGRLGLSAGFSDTYSLFTTCNWLDITGIPAGVYTLKVIVNPESVANPDSRLQENSYNNNSASKLVGL